MKQKAALIIFSILAVISLITYINFRQYAFPEHSVKFEINKHQAESKAIDFASEYIQNPESYQKATIFEIDETAKNYLERELGAKTTGELAMKDASLWHFTTRLFRQLQKEEIYISYAPDGRLVHFSHSIDEFVAGANLDKSQALRKVKQFLNNNCSLCVQNNFPDGWNIIEYSDTNKSNRTDHTFTFERKDYSLKDARQRVKVVVSGAEITFFNEYIKVPSSWVTNFKKEKSYNNTAQIIAEAFSLIFITIPILIIFFKMYRERKLNLKFTHKVAIVVTILTVCNLVNSFSSYYFSYPTTQTSLTILALLILGLILIWIYTYITTSAIIATAESLYRNTFPDKPDTISTLKNIFHNPSIPNGIFIGFCAGISFFVYELSYYFLGRQIGFWVPADLNYNDAFNSIAPWLYPLIIGFLPAVKEEVIYRLFAISLFTKLLIKYISNAKVRLGIAVLISSILWAFLHSAYPQMPFYVRGVELTFVGLALSWLFLRYGILSSISAHYAFNSFQMAVFFLNTKSYTTSTTAFIVASLPLWIAIIARIIQTRNKTVVSDTINNDHDVQTLSQLQKNAHEEPNVLSMPTFTYLSRRAKLLLIVACIVAFFLVIAEYTSGNVASNDNQYSDNDVLIVNRAIATQNAKEFLLENNIPYEHFRTVTTIISQEGNDDVISYLKEYSDTDKINAYINTNNTPQHLWHVRFFQPGQKEEYSVFLNLNGKIYTFSHTLDEQAAGALISQVEAQNTATEYLERNIQDAYAFTVIKKEDLKKDNRNDYRFTFEYNQKIAKAVRIVKVDVIDGKPQNLQSYIELPEDFEREQQQIGVNQLLLVIGIVLLSLFIIALLSNILYILYKDRKLTKKTGIIFALLTVVVTITSQGNHLPVFYSYYDTDLPNWVFIVWEVTSIGISIVLSVLLSIILVNSATALYQQYVGPIFPPHTQYQKRLFGNAIFLFFTLNFIAICIVLISWSVSAKLFPSSSNTAEIYEDNTSNIFIDQIQTMLPVLEGLSVITNSIIVLSVCVLILGVSRYYAKSWKNIVHIAVFIALSIFFLTEWKTSDLLSSLTKITPVLMYYAIVGKYIVRNNIFFYLLTIYYLLVLSQAGPYLNQEDTFISLNGSLHLVFIFLPILFWIFYAKLFKWSQDVHSSKS